MLNEFIEYKQYTFDIDSYNPADSNAVNPRLNHRSLCNSLSGIERAMTVIARYCYYNHCNALSPAPKANDRTALATSVLKTWCGASEECPPGFEKLQCWLPRYLEKVLMAKQCAYFSEKNLSVFLPQNRQTILSCIDSFFCSSSHSERLKAIKQITEVASVREKEVETVSAIRSAYAQMKKKPEPQRQSAREQISKQLSKLSALDPLEYTPEETKSISELVAMLRKEIFGEGEQTASKRVVNALKDLRGIVSKYAVIKNAAASLQRLEKARMELRKKKTEFAKRMLIRYVSDEEASKWNNDFKKITYESIIANAIDRGPLKVRYLAFMKDPFSNDILKKEKGNLSFADIDRIQKMISAFLLGRTNDWQEYAVINKTDIANWCEDDPKMDRGSYEKYMFSQTPLFSVKLVGKNVNKLAVLETFLKATHPMLCDSTEEATKLVFEGCTVYADNGAGKKLEKFSPQERV